MNNKDNHLEMSRMGLNMYNPLQAERSWGYRITTTFSELRSSSICRSEDKDKSRKGRMGENTKGRKETNPVRHCGLEPQSPFIRRVRCVRFLRREASRLYSLGDSDLRQNDKYSDKGLPAYCMLPFPSFLQESIKRSIIIKEKLV
jgi:hypothetical protein